MDQHGQRCDQLVEGTAHVLQDSSCFAGQLMFCRTAHVLQDDAITAVLLAN